MEELSKITEDKQESDSTATAKHKHSLPVLLLKQSKFLESCREVKVRKE